MNTSITIYAVIFSANGKRILGGGNQQVRLVMRVRDGEQVVTISGDGCRLSRCGEELQLEPIVRVERCNTHTNRVVYMRWIREIVWVSGLLRSDVRVRDFPSMHGGQDLKDDVYARSE